MDNFKAAMVECVGHGGLDCPCCNRYQGKYKAILRRTARRAMKQRDRRDLDSQEG